MRPRLLGCLRLVVALFCVVAAPAGAVTFYVHPVLGNDANPGTNSQAPLQSLARATQLQLAAGDKVLLAAGQKFAGQLAFQNLLGTEANPIIISSYQSGDEGGNELAQIDAKGFNAGVLLLDCAHCKIANLAITADAGGMRSGQIYKTDMRCGVLVVADQPGNFAGFVLSNLLVKDVFYEPPGYIRGAEEVRTANGTQKYGWGIRFLASAAGSAMQNISVMDCQIENVCHTGLKLTAPSNGLQNVEVCRLRITRTGGPGVQMSGVSGGHFSNLDVNHSGSTDDSRKWGRGSGLWTWGSHDVIIEKSRFQNANGPGDSAGVHIDYNCRNIIVQYNLSANNAGGFCEILGNNYNCAYRYNVSINDGYRVKGVNGAFQEGKIFWLSGFTGENQPQRGPFNTYFYNNTIYVRNDIVAKIAVSPTAHGVLIANNIFCIQGRSEPVSGDQNRADKWLSSPPQNVVFQNNLYLRSGNWPEGYALQDASPVYGDPGFKNPGGGELYDYIPTNHKLIENCGINIDLIPFDEVGLIGGVTMPRDILGQPIVGKPDLGAIKIKSERQQAGF